MVEIITLVDEMGLAYVDKPMAYGKSALTKFDDGDWVAGPKHDGWNAQVIYVGEESPIVISRDNKELDISSELRDEVQELDLPVGTILNGEWVKRRRKGQREYLYIFDLLSLSLVDGRFDYVREMPFIERYGWVQENVQEADILKISPIYETGFVDLFEKAQEDPDNEGLVLKLKDFELILARTSCKKNPDMLKVKWRDGPGGNKDMSVYD